MWNVAFKSLWARKFRLVMTSLAVLLGVAFMAGTLMLTATMRSNFNDLFAQAYKNTDVVVRSPKAFSTGAASDIDTRPPVDESLVSVVQGVQGVKTARGAIQGYAQLVDKSNKPLGTGGAPTFGGIWSSDPTNPFKLAEGTAPANDNEVVIDYRSAKKTGFKVGDTVKLLVHGPPIDRRVSGIARWGKADSPAGASFMLFTKNAAQHYVGDPGKFSEIEVQGNGRVSQTALRERVIAAVPSYLDVQTGAAITKENQNEVQKSLGFFNRFLLVFAGIALFVGVFIIYNTFSILVAQRTRETALLRTLGATKRQVGRSILLEAFGVGLVAALLGLIAGVAISTGLIALLGAFGVELPSSGIVIPPNAIIASLVVGVTVSLVSAYFPARRASNVPPIAAMRDTTVERTDTSKKRLAFGVLLLLAGVVLILLGLFIKMKNPFIPVAVGVPLTFLGVAALGPILVRPAGQLIGAPAARLRGVSGRLARENAVRNPRRSSATAAALMVGVGLVGFMLIVSASFRESINNTVDKSFSGDFVIQTKGQMGSAAGGLPPQLEAQLNQLSEVQAAAGLAFAPAQVKGKAVFLSGTNMARLTQVVDPRSEQGDIAKLSDEGIAVSRKYADNNHIKLGDSLSVKFVSTGEKTFHVESIYKNDNVLGSAQFLTIKAFSENVPDYSNAMVLVAKTKGVTDEAARAAVDRVAAGYPNAEVQDQTEYKADLSKQINQVLGLFMVLLALAIVIALIGIANTLVLSIYERTRELGLLRAVGMTRRQVRSLVRWEAVIVALFGTFLGFLVAIFFGIAVVRALRDSGVTMLVIPIPSLLVVTVVAALSGVLAAVWPARRASRLNVLDAIATE